MRKHQTVSAGRANVAGNAGKRKRQPSDESLLCLGYASGGHEHSDRMNLTHIYVTGVVTVAYIKHLDYADGRTLEWPAHVCCEWFVKPESTQLLEAKKELLKSNRLTATESYCYFSHGELVHPDLQGKCCVVLLNKLQHASFWGQKRRSFVTHVDVVDAARYRDFLHHETLPPTPLPSRVPLASTEAADDDGQNDDDYTLEQMVAAVKLSHQIKDQEQFESAVMNAAAFAGLSLEDRKLRIPVRTTLYRWRILMDEMVMLYRRLSWSRDMYKDSFFQLGADTSPQLNEDYLVLREDVLTVRRWSDWQNNPLSCLTVEQRTKLLTTVGWGEKALIKLHARVTHACVVESGMEHINSYRPRMRQGYADQGTEAGLWSLPNILDVHGTRDVIQDIETGRISLDSIEASHGRMWPNAWEIPGFLHILWNALKKAVMSMPPWKELEVAFRAIAVFLCKRGLRRRFIAKCCIGLGVECSLFYTWEGGNFSWRWEKLFIFLVQLRPRLVILGSRFNYDAMMDDSDVAPADDDAAADPEETKTILAKMHKALKIRNLRVWVELLYVKVKCVVLEIVWLEGCYCHPMSDSDLHERLPGNDRACRDRNCPWRGRRIVEIVMGRPQQVVTSIVNTTSSEFTEMLAAVSEEERGEFLVATDQFVLALTEEWSAKFRFCTDYPLKFLRVMSCYFGGTMAASRTAFEESLAWYDGLPNKAVCPPCLAMFLNPGNYPMVHVEEYIKAEGKPLHHYWVLFEELVVAAVLMCSERRLEGQHSIIGSHGSQMLTNVALPPTVCALVRAPQFFAAVQEDAFWKVLRTRSTRWDRLLKHCCSATQIRIMTISQKYAKLHMYDERSTFCKNAEEQELVRRWRKATVHARPSGALPMTEAQSCLVDYFRTILRRGVVFSVPPFTDEVPTSNTAASIAETLQAPRPELSEGEVAAAVADMEGLQVFEVVVAKPSSRSFAQSSSDITPTASMLSVRALRCLSIDGGSMRTDAFSPHSFFSICFHGQRAKVLLMLFRMLQFGERSTPRLTSL